LDDKVHPVCKLIPLLYLIFDEAIIREATDTMETGISVGGLTPSDMQMTKLCVANSQNSERVTTTNG